MASKKGTSREIITQGLSSPDGLGIATQGFIEPILGDLIFGGSAGVVIQGSIGGLVTGGSALVIRGYLVATDGGLITGGVGNIELTSSITGSGGLIFGGAADVTTSIIPTVGGNVSLGGTAQVNVLWNIFPQGGIITGGDGVENITYNVLGAGGLVVDGDGNINVTFTTGDGTDGGLNTGGEAGVDSNVGPKIFGRGGARIPPRRRQPTTVFEPPIYNPDHHLQPMDYLKKIQDALEQAAKEKQELYKYLSKGTLMVQGRAQVIAVFRDQPDGHMVVANNPPLVPITLELPSVFSKGATAREISELEDHLFLNDIMGLGNYKIKTGVKARYVQHSKKTTSGAAKVSFVSGNSGVKMVTRDDKVRQNDDEAIILDMLPRSRQDQEEEELRLLGIID